jgi:hypothetical protein
MCCLLCAYWLRGYAPSKEALDRHLGLPQDRDNDFGWCQNVKVRLSIIEGLDGSQKKSCGVGIETWAGCVCEKFEPK